MSDFFRFRTASPRTLGVLIDLEQVCAIWEGDTQGHIMIELSGHERPLEVLGDFYDLCKNWIEHEDPTDIVPLKKKPSPPKRRGKSQVKAFA